MKPIPIFSFVKIERITMYTLIVTIIKRNYKILKKNLHNYKLQINEINVNKKVTKIIMQEI